MVSPLIFTMTSPRWIPALAAAVSGVTPLTSTPEVPVSLSAPMAAGLACPPQVSLRDRAALSGRFPEVACRSDVLEPLARG